MPSGPDLIGPVFGLLCRLTADRRQAEWLTARVMASSVSPAQALDEARRLYVLDSATTAASAVGDDPIAAMPAEARVADERNPDSPYAALWRGRDLWLDDDTRQRIRDMAITVPSAVGVDADGAQGMANPAPMSPRRKRTLLVSAGLTVAVLAAMVASSAIGSDNDALGEDGFVPTSATTADSDDSPDTTDDTATTETTDDTGGTVPFTVVIETTVPDPVTAPGFILDDDPAGMQFAGSWENAGGGAPPNGWLQLWASPDADRTAGRWAVIATVDGDLGYYCCDVRLDGTRVDIDGAPALVSTSPDGVSDVVTVTTDGERVNVRSFGYSIEEIARLVAGIAAEGGDEPVLDADALAVLDGSSRTVSRAGGWGSADGLLWDDVDSRGVNYADVAEPHGFVWIDTTSAHPTTMIENRLLLQRPSIDVAPGGSVTIAGREVLVSFDPGSDGVLPTYVLRYIDGEDLVTIGGQIDFGRLIAIVADAHRASPNQWRRTIAREAEPIDMSTMQPTSMQQEFTSAGRTAIGDARWEVAVSADPRAVQVSFNSDEISNGGPIAELEIDDRPVQYLTSLDATLVVAIVTDTPLGVSGVLFTPEGAAPVLVPLRELTGSTDSAAAYAYATYGPCLVQLVGPNGEIIGELTPEMVTAPAE